MMSHPSVSTITMAVIYRCGNAMAMPLAMERGRDDWNLDYNLRFMLSSRLGVRPNDISYVDYLEGVALKEAVSSLCNDARDDLLNSRSFIAVGVDLLKREHDVNRPQGLTGASIKHSYQVLHTNPQMQNPDMNLLLEKFNKLEANLNRLENSMTKSIVSHVTDILTDKDRLQETKPDFVTRICEMGDSMEESAVRNLNLVCPPSEAYACKSPTDASSISDVEIITSPSECGDYFEVVDRPGVLGSSCSSYHKKCSMNSEGFVPEPKLLSRLPGFSAAACAVPMPSGPLNLVANESVLEPVGAIASTRSASEDGSTTEVPEECSVIGDAPSMAMLPVLSDLASVSSARLMRLVQMLRAELQLGGDQTEVDDRPAEVLWKLCADPRGPTALVNALRALLGEIPQQANDEHDLAESVDARSLFLALNSVSQLPAVVSAMSMVASSFSSETTASAFENISASRFLPIHKSSQNSPVFVDPATVSSLCQEAMTEDKISASTAVLENAGVSFDEDSEISNVVKSNTSSEHQLLEAAVMDDEPKTGGALNFSDELTPHLCTAGGDARLLGAAAQAQSDAQEGDYESSIASASRRVLDWLRRVTDHTRPAEEPAEADSRVGAITTLVDMGFSDIDQIVGLLAKHGHQDLLPVINELLDQQFLQN